MQKKSLFTDETDKEKRHTIILELQPYIFFCVLFQKEHNPLNFATWSQKEFFVLRRYEKLLSPSSRLKFEEASKTRKLL